MHDSSVAPRGLEWVIVEGVARHVSDFSTLAARDRPQARCPVCARRLTLKLGNVLRHHAAHRAGVVCAATQPETALHIGCKLALAAALRQAASADAMLSIRRTCAECDATIVREWVAGGWDAVGVELRIGMGRRPDVTLKRSGIILAAIEVVVSNQVTDDKARALAELGVPWVEVVAREHLATPNGWTPNMPLDVVRMSEELEWRCEIHEATHAAAREAARQSTTLVAARVVDVYHATGSRERLIYRVSRLERDGEPYAIRLQRGGLELLQLGTESVADIRERAWPMLRAAFTADVEHETRRDGSFADSPMRWARATAAENIVDEALSDRVGRDPTPLATRFPRRWFYVRDRHEWFVPPDMRGVRWDRPEPDAFAAHPAWARAHAAVREHPAPEGSWATPVFASRPIAAMFRDGVRSVSRPGDAGISVIDLASAASAESAAAAPAASGRRRAIVVLERESSVEAIESVAESLAAESVEAFWISHPRDWSPVLTRMAWAPAGRDWKGRGGVVIDGLGVFRADQFARALVKGDRRISVDAVKMRMEARVKRMGGSGGRIAEP